jgi:hypothetical protein
MGWPSISDVHVKSEDRIFMMDIRAGWRLIRVFPIVAFSIVLPACRTAGAPPPAVRSTDPDTSRFALRPILDGAGYRPYYLQGYAGASYGPGLFGRPAVPVAPMRPVGPATPVSPAAPPPPDSGITVENGTWAPE